MAVVKRDIMNTKFRKPDFRDRQIELRVDGGEVCIYATKAGLEKLISFCKELIESPSKGHIHLEDYEVLTRDSLKGTISVFKSS